MPHDGPCAASPDICPLSEGVPRYALPRLAAKSAGRHAAEDGLLIYAFFRASKIGSAGQVRFCICSESSSRLLQQGALRQRLVIQGASSTWFRLPPTDLSQALQPQLLSARARLAPTGEYGPSISAGFERLRGDISQTQATVLRPAAMLVKGKCPDGTVGSSDDQPATSTVRSPNPSETSI